MNKKNIIVFAVIILIFSAGIIAVTQEAEYFVDIPEIPIDIALELDDEYEDVLPYSGYIYAREIPDWVRSIRWFHSNAGGLVIEEMPSRFAALRREYAVSVDFAQREDLPDDLLPFYDDDCYIEVRILYEKGIQIRTQWIFRDFDGMVKLVAAFSDKEEKTGFIEIFDEKGLLSVEYAYLDNDQSTRTNYVFKDGILLSAAFHVWEEEEEDSKGEFAINYTDTFQYNRNLFLRAIERRYHNESHFDFSEEPVRLTLPVNIKDAVEDKFFIGARYNSLPEFFGVATISKDYKMIYVTDDRSRILTQTLYDEEDNALWVITNTWKEDRIITSSKKEGDTEIVASYDYDSRGDRIRESNYKNGVLERVVRIEGSTEVEELYLDNVVVLRAIWEDGRKISETRIKNN